MRRGAALAGEFGGLVRGTFGGHIHNAADTITRGDGATFTQVLHVVSYHEGDCF